MDGGIGIIEMLEATNIIALVGAGNKNKFNKDCLLIWDDSKSLVLCEFRFPCYILNVKINREK